MADEAQRRLRALVSEQGPSVVNDRQRCQYLIRDYGLADRGSVNILIAALDENIPSDLRKPDAAGTPDLLMASLRGRLQTNHGQTEDASRWAVESWALALELLEDATARVPVVSAADPLPEIREVPSRSPWGRPAVQWSVAAALMALTIVVYSLSAIGVRAEKSRSALLVRGLQEQIDQRKIFPAPALNLTAESHVAKNKKGDTLTISFNIDGASGSASGTIQRSGVKIENFNWKLNLVSITTHLKDGSSNFVLQTSDREMQRVQVNHSSDGKYYVDGVCIGFFQSVTEGCFE